jgi:hypothetical protein
MEKCVLFYTIDNLIKWNSFHFICTTCHEPKERKKPADWIGPSYDKEYNETVFLSSMTRTHGSNKNKYDFENDDACRYCKYLSPKSRRLLVE